MTIKLYKKKRRWYYMFKGHEYHLPQTGSIDALATLLGKTKIYITISNERYDSLPKYVYVALFDNELITSDALRTLIRVLGGPAESYSIPKEICPLFNQFHAYKIKDIK